MSYNNLTGEAKRSCIAGCGTMPMYPQKATVTEMFTYEKKIADYNKCVVTCGVMVDVPTIPRPTTSHVVTSDVAVTIALNNLNKSEKPKSEPTVMSTRPQESLPEKGTSTGLKIGIGVGVLIVVVGLAMAFKKKSA